MRSFFEYDVACGILEMRVATRLIRIRKPASFIPIARYGTVDVTHANGRSYPSNSDERTFFLSTFCSNQNQVQTMYII